MMEKTTMNKISVLVFFSCLITQVCFLNIKAASVGTELANKHLGVATCASSVCHGSPIERGQSNINQNEYIIWQNEDLHAKAYQVLLNERSIKIANNLDIGKAHEAKICLDCHTDNVPKEKRGNKFLLSDGVGCEACHGGSEKWLDKHTNGDHKQSLAQGLIPLDDTLTKAKLCLSCHLGTAEKFASHDIMGAGHPRLRFELETYGALQPYHYVVDADYKKRKKADDGAKTWAIGQVAMANGLLSLLQEPKFIDKHLIPELALFDCHACHAPMNADKWQTRVTSKGLGPGKIRLNDSALVMLSFFAESFKSESDDSLLTLVRELHLATTQNKNALKTAAANLQIKVEKLLNQLNQSPFNNQSLINLRSTIVKQGSQGQFSDYLSAEQAAMAIDLLSRRIDINQYDSLVKPLDNLFNAIADENKFRPAQFISAMSELEKGL